MMYRKFVEYSDLFRLKVFNNFIQRLNKIYLFIHKEIYRDIKSPFSVRLNLTSS